MLYVRCWNLVSSLPSACEFDSNSQMLFDYSLKNILLRLQARLDFAE